MNGNGRAQTKIPDVAGRLADVAHDVIELSELQAQLFALDVKKSSQQVRTCIILGVVGVCFLLGTIPVALIALAQLFVETLSWSQAAAYAVAAIVGLAISATVAGVAWTMCRSGLISLERSRSELRRNIGWFKSTLRNRSRPSDPPPSS